MQLTRSLRLGFVVLLAVHLLTAFGAVALLGRMQPAIQLIIDENVRSLEAVEDTLALLADLRAPDREARAEAALGRIRANANLDEERRILGLISPRFDDALYGDEEAMHLVTEELRKLGEFHRQEMERADQRAQELGSAGAWTVVIFALLTLAGGIVARRRLDRHVLSSLEELHDVVEQLEDGDDRRRCQRDDAAAGELGQLMHTLNTLLDERAEWLAPDDDAPHMQATADRGVLLYLLERLEGPSAVLDREGRLVAATRAMMDQIATDDDAMDRLKAAAAQADGEDGIVLDGVRAVPVGDRVVVSLRHASSDRLAASGESLSSGE